MKTKTPPYTISLYRTTNGIFPYMKILKIKKVYIFEAKLEINYPYKSDASAKRAIIRLAKRMGLIK